MFISNLTQFEVLSFPLIDSSKHVCIVLRYPLSSRVKTPVFWLSNMVYYSVHSTILLGEGNHWYKSSSKASRGHQLEDHHRLEFDSCLLFQASYFRRLLLVFAKTAQILWATVYQASVDNRGLTWLSLLRLLYIIRQYQMCRSADS